MLGFGSTAPKKTQIFSIQTNGNIPIEGWIQSTGCRRTRCFRCCVWRFSLCLEHLTDSYGEIHPCTTMSIQSISRERDAKASVCASRWIAPGGGPSTAPAVLSYRAKSGWGNIKTSQSMQLSQRLSKSESRKALSLCPGPYWPQDNLWVYRRCHLYGS